MPFYLKSTQQEHLLLLRERSAEDVIDLCKCAFDYLVNGPNTTRYEGLAQKFQISNASSVQNAIEALISLLIDATKANVNETHIQALQQETGFSADVLEVLAQFVTSKRSFVEGSVKSANIRAYRLVNLEWRLEAIVASRALLQQHKVCIVMKLYLHTEPKNENRDLLEPCGQELIHADEKRNRKDFLVQTDINSLLHIIQTLEDALIESKTRRIRNIVNAL